MANKLKLQAPVERFKITPWQKRWQKQYRELKRMEMMLKYEAETGALDWERGREMFEELEQDFQELRPPENPVYDLHGQDIELKY